MLHVRRIDRGEEFACLRAEWNGLLDPASPRGVFLRHEWVHNWFAAYGAGSRPAVLVATQGGELQAVLPLRACTDRFAGLPLSRLDLMANGHSPLADLVARPGAEAQATAAFAAFLLEAENWDLAVFPEVEASAPLAALATHFAPQARLVQPQRRAPFIPLNGDWESFRSTLSKNFVRALRNNRNRIARHGGAAVQLLEAPAAIAAALPDVFTIGERSWQGEAGSAVGSDAASRAFYGGLVRELAPLGLLRLWFLELAGRRVAFELHVVHGGVEFGLKSGFDRQFESLGAGSFLDQHIVEHLFGERRVHEYDLLGDADGYKLRWTNQTRPYVRLSLFGQGARARMLSLWNLELKPALKLAQVLGRPGRRRTPAAVSSTNADEGGAA
jgi:CelD/BcsL family acetyltransferase involved in cellulose biosynthesis